MSAKFEVTRGINEDAEKFALYDDANEGDEILVAVDGEDEVHAFAQVSGNQIFFIESEGSGAGTAIVDYLKAEYEELVARNVSPDSSGYWAKVGFERAQATGERPNEYDYVWYRE